MLTIESPKLKRLSAAEQLRRSHENTDVALDRYRLSDHADLKDTLKRLGRQFSHQEFIRRVEKVTHRRVWAEESLRDPSVMGFYHIKNGVKSYVCAFDKGTMPEFSIILTDTADLPVKERRGWRTVVTRLLQTGAMTWTESNEAFGDTDHAASERWRFNTRDFRK